MCAPLVTAVLVTNLAIPLCPSVAPECRLVTWGQPSLPVFLPTPYVTATPEFLLLSEQAVKACRVIITFSYCDRIQFSSLGEETLVASVRS